jgi:hypothetical protein
MECVKDSGYGIACSSLCIDEIKSLYAAIKRNKLVYSIAARASLRNAIWIFLLATGFIAFGLWTKDDFPFSAYLLGMGLLFVLGSAFAFLNSRRMARLSKGDTVNPVSKGPM